MPERPARAMARLPLHFIWMLDCSGSMQGEKMKSPATSHSRDKLLLIQIIPFRSNAAASLRCTT